MFDTTFFFAELCVVEVGVLVCIGLLLLEVPCFPILVMPKLSTAGLKIKVSSAPFEPVKGA